MGNRSSQQVFQNDYIMIDMVRSLHLRQQYILQKVCQRLRYVVIDCIWSQDCRDIQMNSIKMGGLTDEEFFDFLQLNAGNIRKLTLEERDGRLFAEYFVKPYDNMMELQIKGFSLDVNDYDLIASKCPRMQLFHYDRMKGKSNCMKFYKNDLWSLAAKAPIHHLVLYDVKLWKRDQVPLHNLKILKIYNRLLNHCPESLKFIKNCINLQELDITPAHSLEYNFCDNCSNLEKLRISRTLPLRTAWHVMKLKKLKHLEFDAFIDDTASKDTLGNGHNVGKSLQTLKIYQSIFTNTSFTKPDVWVTIFQSPKTNFDNLQELFLRSQYTNDELMQIIVIKCPQLVTLRLSHCSLTGRYISNMTKLQCLEICDNRQRISWPALHCILRDLKFLQYLNLYRQEITYDQFSNISTVQHLTKSLKELKIHSNNDQLSFWEYFFKYCDKSSLQCLHTFHIIDYSGVDEMLFENVFANCQYLNSLQLIGYKSEPNRKCRFEMMPYVKNLVLSNCEINLTWSNIIELLKCSKLECLEIYNTPIYNFEFPSSLETDHDIMLKLRSVTVSYTIFKQTLSLWQRFFEKRCHFQLCCFDHSDHRIVLNDILQNTSLCNKVISVHVNAELKTTKDYLTSTMGASDVSVCWLDYDQLGLQRQFFFGISMIIVIMK